MTDIQFSLNELAKKFDNRISVFEIEIQELRNSTLQLGGRVLDESQLEELRRALPGLKLDLHSVRVLDRQPLEQLHVATNLTGLYEKPGFGGPLSSELAYGTELEVLDTENRWVFTRQRDGYLGWAYRPYLESGVAREATHLVLAPAVEIRAEPKATGEVISRVFGGTGVAVEESRDGWSCIVAGRSGWIPSHYLRALASLPESVEERRVALMKDARSMIGVPYLWGGTSGNGIDCSGFARLLHRWIGIQIPRDADMQHDAARTVEPPFAAGDLLFFGEGEASRNITHVGISLGGWNIIHSSRSNNGVYVDNLQEKKTLMDIFVSAGSYIR